MDQYIAQLLQQHPRVVVPKLGTFIASFTGAAVNKAAGQVTPPLSRLAFSISEEGDASLLERTVRAATRLDKDGFDERLFQYVQGIFNALNVGGQYAVEGVGVLQKTDDGHIGLVPHGQLALPDDHFGLPALSGKPLTPGQGESSAPVAKPETVGGAAIGQSIPVNPPPKKQTEAVPAPGAANNRWWWAVIPLALLFLVLLYWMLDPQALNGVRAWFKGNEVVQADLEPVERPVTQPDNQVPLDTDVPAVEQENPATVEPAPAPKPLAEEKPKEKEAVKKEKPVQETAPEPAPAETNTYSTSLPPGYFVQLGAFSKEASAIKLKRSAQNAGHSTDIILHPERKLYLVVIGGLADEQEANTKAGELNQDDRFKGAIVKKN
ncbi:MAG: SPOR domain-containing protein [Bernardetiaceae bacterium]|jgi:cell division septation protein DedD|nr:SPOR domain-containing protein [Bernardetiaceae bacterium]